MKPRLFAIASALSSPDIAFGVHVSRRGEWEYVSPVIVEPRHSIIDAARPIQRAVDMAIASEMLIPGITAMAREQQELVEQCRALGLAIDGIESFERLQRLRDTTTSTPMMFANASEISETFRALADDFLRGRRKAKNKRKRERRARRGKL